MEILLDRGENISSHSNLNFVATSDKIYIIDNHLAAFWCMTQLDLTRRYNFLHIDRHYDLKPYNKTTDSSILHLDIKSIRVAELTSFRTNINNRDFSLIRWDNYINLFDKRYPTVINEALFITQKQGDLLFNKSYREIEIYELFAHDFKTKHKWIFNIDIDFFFTRPEDNLVQMYSDEYIEEIGLWLNKEYENCEQIIFCLSPECCGGWDESKRVMKIIIDCLNT